MNTKKMQTGSNIHRNGQGERGRGSSGSGGAWSTCGRDGGRGTGCSHGDYRDGGQYGRGIGVTERALLVEHEVHLHTAMMSTGTSTRRDPWYLVADEWQHQRGALPDGQPGRADLEAKGIARAVAVLEDLVPVCAAGLTHLDIEMVCCCIYYSRILYHFRCSFCIIIDHYVTAAFETTKNNNTVHSNNTWKSKSRR